MTSIAVQGGAGRTLIDLLPAVYRQSRDLGPFLAAFEAILFAPRDASGSADAAGAEAQPHGKSLEEQIGAIPSLIDPGETGEEFLDWLAQWAAVAQLAEARDRRGLIAAMVPLYRIRGTRRYVERVLGFYVSGRATVEEEDLSGMAVGIPGQADIGVGTRLGEDPFRFSVFIEFDPIPGTPQERSSLVALARKIIDLAKPAHSYYRLAHNLPDDRGLVVSIRSALGVDTLLERPESRARGGSRSYERDAR